MARQDERNEKNRAQMTNLFADIILQLSEESMEKTKEHNDYHRALETNDCVQLWNIVTEVHSFKDK